VLAGAEHVISFHIVTEGSCWAEAVDHSAPPVPLQAGDIVVFPAGNANIIASSPGMRGRPDPAQYYRPADRTLPFSLATAREPGAAHTRFVCGFLGCDTRPFNPRLDALPRIVRVPISTESRRWLDSLVGIAVQASGGESAGREAMLAKLAELMFVEAIRSHLDRLPADARDWLAGVRDPQVGAAHCAGVKGVVDEADVASGKVPIIAPGTIESFNKHAIGENVITGSAMSRRMGYTFQLLLPHCDCGLVTFGLSACTSAMNSKFSYLAPTDASPRPGRFAASVVGTLSSSTPPIPKRPSRCTSGSPR
jgi:Cupin